MKITNIHIKDHQQFKDLKLDLTYPLGHPKAGQPLDKVCFIGQSGTGKTTLLEEICDYMMHRNLPRFTAPIKRTNITLKRTNTINKPTIYFHINQHHTPTVSSSSFSFPLSLNKDNGWNNIKDAITKHQQEITRYSFAISRAFRDDNYDLANEYKAKLKAWEEQNETPLLDLAQNYLNPILQEFGLALKTDLESLEERDQVNLINKNLETIPQQYWSSGIKNIISRTVPLYANNFQDCVICIDEPETSLYPDIQRKIINLYTKLAPNNQFFFATHSPIIASNFEPWEIVELKFDEEGYVYRDQYWEGENHVDNYKFYPQYLRWDAILQNIFDLENDGSDARKKMLQDFSNLDNKLKERKRKGEALSKDDKEVQELLDMGKKLGWDTKSA